MKVTKCGNLCFLQLFKQLLIIQLDFLYLTRFSLSVAQEKLLFPKINGWNKFLEKYFKIV